jgi:hypothetical protein
MQVQGTEAALVRVWEGTEPRGGPTNAAAVAVARLPPASAEPVYPSTAAGLRALWRSPRGWRSLFRGLAVNWVKVVPSTAVGFATYEMLRGWLGVPDKSSF